MKKYMILIIAAVLITAMIVTMGAVATKRSMERSDRTIERVDRIWEKHGK